MQRTQIYLDKHIIELLAQLSKKTGKTRSELVREAIQQIYSNQDLASTLVKAKSLSSFMGMDDSINLRRFRG
ncbi:MAG: ribbon-helix-helix protein, CopG family [Candidatus Dojkabacteria bacterium]